MEKHKTIAVRRQRRRWHVRNKLRGNSTRPRLSVFRSHKNVSCQIIDDASGKTVASASTRDATIRDQIRYGGNREAAAIVGRAIAERALAAGVTTVQFDRGHYQYHGRVAALADAAREAGLQF